MGVTTHQKAYSKEKAKQTDEGESSEDGERKKKHRYKLVNKEKGTTENRTYQREER